MPQRESDSSRKRHHYSDTLLVLAIAGLAHTDNGFLVVNDRERFNMWLVEGDRSAAPVTPTTRQ
jgi:hypothetical protein